MSPADVMTGSQVQFCAIPELETPAHISVLTMWYTPTISVPPKVVLVRSVNQVPYSLGARICCFAIRGFCVPEVFILHRPIMIGVQVLFEEIILSPSVCEPGTASILPWSLSIQAPIVSVKVYLF